MSALQRVVDGGDISGGVLSAGVPDPAMLDPDEHEAWTELRLWTQDVGAHAGDTNYTRFKRGWMRDRLAVLRGPVRGGGMAGTA